VKGFSLLRPLFLAAGTACAIHSARADLQIVLSVKFILNSDGSRPQGGIGDAPGFLIEVMHGNQVLLQTGRGFGLIVVEYLDIQPTAPTGQPADYWFNLAARENRRTVENAARVDPATWRWNRSAINLYVNNSTSGQCSFVGDGSAVTLGKDIGAGTVLHEIGHIFNLLHTHAGDNDSNPSMPPFTLADLSDGDGLAETVADNPNITTKDQLCGALFGLTYNAATPQQRGVVDSSFENVMSYHNENQLLPGQMDIWSQNAIGSRLGLCRPRAWFVAFNGSDSASGATEARPFATLPRALLSAATSVGPVNDDIFLGDGSYFAPPGGVISTPCALRAPAGAVNIIRQP